MLDLPLAIYYCHFLLVAIEVDGLRCQESVFFIIVQAGKIVLEVNAGLECLVLYRYKKIYSSGVKHSFECSAI